MQPGSSCVLNVELFVPKKQLKSIRGALHSLRHINEKTGMGAFLGGSHVAPSPRPHTQRHPTAKVIPINIHTVVSLKNSITTTAPFHNSWILECSMGVPTHAGTVHKHPSSFLRLVGDTSLMAPQVSKAHLHDILLITLKCLHSEYNSQEIAQS